MLQKITRGVAVAGLSLLLIQAILIVIDGILRSAVAISLDAVRDVGPLITAVAVACCLPLVLLESGNIVMRPLTTFPKPLVGQVGDIFGAFIAAAVMALLTVQFFLFAMSQLRSGETTFMLNISKAPFYFAIAGAIALGALNQAFVFLGLIKKRKDQDHAGR